MPGRQANRPGRPAARGAADLAWSSIRFDPRAISIAEGVRAALSVAVIVAANEWLRWPPLMEAALAALLTCMCDPGGPVRSRVRPLATFAVLGALAAGGFGFARAGGVWVALPLATVGIFLASFARIYGQAGLQVGNLMTVVIIFALDRALPVPAAALTGAIFLAGGLWAALLTLVIWRLHPFRPVRRAVADCYRALALLTGDLRVVLQHPESNEAAWERHARAHRRAVREAIEAARTAILGILRARGPVSPRATQALIRLEVADQSFGALIALSEMLEQADPAIRAPAAEVLRRLRPILLVLAEVIQSDDTPHLPRIGRSIDAMVASAGDASGGRLAELTGSIAERLRIALTLAAPADLLAGSPGAAAGGPTLRQRLLGPVSANLRWHSAPLRHALRAAVAVVPALAYTLTHPTPYGHWLTITLVLTMQPYFGLTWLRALERIGGTVLGGLIAAGLAVFLHTPLAIAAALFPLVIIAMSLRTVSYALYITGLTPIVVLLVELGLPGTSELTIALMRALNTIAGGALAVAGCLILWPSWEPARAAIEVRTAIEAHARYAAAVFAALLGEAPAAAVNAARGAAGVASNNLEASLSRAMLEPRPNAGAKLEPALVIDAALRRMAGRLAAMQPDLTAAAALAGTSLPAWRDWTLDSLGRLAARSGAILPRPAEPPSPGLADSLLRIARQIELMEGIVTPAGA